ncbi:MAG: c-type cytochrome [Gammaproteobacteria bacterium]
MKVASVSSILFASILAGAQAFAAETPTSPFEGAKADVGATKAAVCGACHGVGGNSQNPEWPNLAGQSPAYIDEQLHLFKTEVRVNPVMKPIIDTVDEQDFKNLAVYFAAQTPAGLEADPSYWKAGEKLYRKGDPARQIPACAACHGPLGRGNLAAAYPALRAQHSVYTVKQLNDYAKDTRYPGATAKKPATPNAIIMATIAKRLTAEDIRDVASYVQGMR